MKYNADCRNCTNSIEDAPILSTLRTMQLCSERCLAEAKAKTAAGAAARVAAWEAKQALNALQGPASASASSQAGFAITATKK